MIHWKNPVMRALDETGLPWQVENGHGHKKIKLCGRLVGVMSGRKDRVDPRAEKNVICQIKRMAQELQA
jgi:hypothetical protein